MTSTTEAAPIRRGYADSPLGQIHFVETGSGDPVLFLHETPRSWDQYRDVLPIVGRQRRALAMDTLGFGDSCSPREDRSQIEAYAEGVVYLLDALEIDRVSLVGHHTGGVVAIEVAAAEGDRIDKLIVSSTPLTNAEFVEATRGFSIDVTERSEDGAHLMDFWGQRAPHYPDEDRTELLDRFMVDALRSGKHAAGGHAACAGYEMEPRLDLIVAEFHLILGGADEHALEHSTPFVERVGPASVQTVDGGPVPMPEHKPEEFAAAVERALEQ
ncbi:MAG: alpha/beta fold hydrolase [Actinobacteria bacterium]|nr:alpha/beta fold hydrolase [Actinomycetota bacterium]